jgi:UPF0755 protein
MKSSSQWVLGGLVFTATLIFVIAALSFWWAAHEFQKPGPAKEAVLVDIPSGSGLRQIAGQLTDAGAITNPYIFIFGTTIMGAQTGMKAGEYQVEPNMSASEIMMMIREGRIVGRRVTIPEGLTSYEVEKIVSELKDLQQVSVEDLKEGTLLPETYDYKKTDTSADLIQHMSDAMTKTIDELWEGRATNLPFTTKEEAITLASIVEKETGVASERKRVAGVFINRLRKGIALQTDPTVIYAITKGKPKTDGKGPLGRRLLTKDLEFDSPYNTYLHPGLPPGPIANPGRAAIEAVLHPEEHDFLYFVADGTGGHIFSATLAEHDKNVAEWRTIRKEKEKEAKEEAKEAAKNKEPLAVQKEPPPQNLLPAE